jgi:lysophospholipase L1-like esterase
MRVLVFGDSITQGFWDVEGGWVGRLRKHYDQIGIQSRLYDQPTIFNLGVSGDTSSDIIDRLEQEIQARIWPGEEFVFVFAFGINDSSLYKGTPRVNIDTFRSNLQKILGIAQKHSQKIAVIEITPCIEERTDPTSWDADYSYRNDLIDLYNKELKDITLSSDVLFIEVAKSLLEAQAQEEVMTDGVHPDTSGHEHLFRIILSEIEKLVERD